jgi:hypothetical protein
VQRVEVDDVEPGRSGPYATTEARDIDVVVTSYNPDTATVGAHDRRWLCDSTCG